MPLPAFGCTFHSRTRSTKEVLQCRGGHQVAQKFSNKGFPTKPRLPRADPPGVSKTNPRTPGWRHLGEGFCATRPSPSCSGRCHCPGIQPQMAPPRRRGLQQVCRVFAGRRWKEFVTDQAPKLAYSRRITTGRPSPHIGPQSAAQVIKVVDQQMRPPPSRARAREPHTERIHRLAMQTRQHAGFIAYTVINQCYFSRFGVIAKQLQINIRHSCRRAMPDSPAQMRTESGHTVHPAQSHPAQGTKFGGLRIGAEQGNVLPAPHLRPPRCRAAACGQGSASSLTAPRLAGPYSSPFHHQAGSGLGNLAGQGRLHGADLWLHFRPEPSPVRRESPAPLHPAGPLVASRCVHPTKNSSFDSWKRLLNNPAGIFSPSP